MACNNRRVPGTDIIESNCHKDDNDDKGNTTRKCQIFFKNAIDHYEDRRDDLDCRQKMLNAKIAVMERSIPVLMALSMRKAEEVGQIRNSAEAVEQVRELMKDLMPPTPDPADELVADLTVHVEQLNRETTELHDKIINADIQLEENCIELESLELTNRELEEQIEQLQSKLDFKPSLGSISSEDRICLAKIRRLGEIKAHKKRNIQELEDKETLLRCLIEKILGPKPIKQKRLCDVVKNDSKHHMYRSKCRKKKERQKIEKSRQNTEINQPFCGNISCNALKKMMENKTMACKCYKELLSSSSKSCDNNKSCNCGRFRLESQTQLDRIQEDPWCSFL